MKDQFLIDVRKKALSTNNSGYPFCLPAVQHLTKLDFHPQVTFLVGENGSGKSTLLEAIAIEFGFNPEGGSKNFNFATEASYSELHKFITLSKGATKPRNSYFLRAESFYNVASNIDQLDREGEGKKIIDFYGGISLHKQSHGESFWTLFTERFSGHGLYLLDEPEAALSPQRQFAFLARLHQLVQEGSQFIIATHSPILLSYPNSIIYEITKDKTTRIKYSNTEHTQLYKAFLNNPDSVLKELGIL
jgi:predicted ATPase